MSISLLSTFAGDGEQSDVTVEKINEIITAVNESGGGGGGGGDTYPMHQAVWYDNSTAMAGTDTGSGMGLDPDMVYGALIRVTDPNAGLAGIGVRDPDGGNFQAAGGVELAATGAQTAMPATLADVATAGDRVTEAPYLAFSIVPN